MTDDTSPVCRLCEGELAQAFALRVLNRLNVAYFKCKSCGSLQTEAPYWLEEAYAHSLAFLDTGAVQRNLTNVAAVVIAARLLGLRNIKDFGGGDGMLCRLLRDYGLNCFVEDKYALPTYAAKFTKPDFENPDIVLSFEVLEHLKYPSIEIDALFARKPKLVMASTLAYEGQGSDWWYLTPETGQHVFFYSPPAFDLIARKFGYRLIRRGGFTLFLRADRADGIRPMMLHAALNKVGVRCVRAALSVIPPTGAYRDFDALRKAS